MESDSESGLPGKTVSRRQLLRRSAQTVGAIGAVAASHWALPRFAHAYQSGADDLGPLLPPSSDGLMLPAGFSSRVVAVAGSTVGSTSFVWPLNPDGGATYPTTGGGWIYVANAETDLGLGGVSAIRFDSDAEIVDAYSILTGTNRNCAGGATPWGTWLSCEEVVDGKVFECDPQTPNSQGTLVASLGTFNHEAVAVDPVHEALYLTEDRTDGLLYRFTPTSYPDLGTGVFEAAEILDPLSQGPIQPGQTRGLAWHTIHDQNPSAGGVQNATHVPIEERATRYQAPNATPFNGGEGCWIRGSKLYFSSKGDHRVWVVDTNLDEIAILYDHATSSMQDLLNPDNVFAAPNGDVYVAEDPGDLQIVALTPSGNVKPIVQVTGQTGSEITGPALSPDGSRLYFSSQRLPGTTYEVTGPFNGIPAIPSVTRLGHGLLFGALATIAAIRNRTK